MRRRDFIGLVGGAAASGIFESVPARAQQPGVPVVGFLNSGSLSGYRNLLIAFRKGLAELNYIEGQNIVIEYRWAEGQFTRLPALAADLVQRGATVIVTGGIGSALGARAASATIPVVFLAGDDPVKFGLVASLNRPGGPATGLAWLTSELFSKRLGLMRELLSGEPTMGVLVNRSSPEAAPQLEEIEAAARALKQKIEIVSGSNDAEIETAFATLVARRAGALTVSNDAFFNSRRELIVALAARHRLPAIFDRREYALVGGLISYGTSYTAAYRELGLYAAKILKGENPADMPVERATKFELVINLKTAKTLGLDVPDRMLALADEVIE